MSASTALRARPTRIHALPSGAPPAADFVGSSPEIERLLARADRLALTTVPVLIAGESGVGKEVLARRIHAESARAGAPFVALNCAAIPEALVESELFGHARGSFTGADRDREGVFQRADGGTLFLDEIGEMPVAMQAKLLRVLEDGRVRPVGGSQESAVDVRVLSATNRRLDELVSEGRFREDLFYRLRGATLAIPPLRERAGGVAELARHFLDELNREHGTHRSFSRPLLTGLEARRWAGNVRELRNEVALLYHLAEGDVLEALEEERPISRAAADPATGTGLVCALATLEEIERDAVRLALASTGSREEAARRLGISRSSIYEKIRRYALADA